jgi:hypothetical protein
MCYFNHTNLPFYEIANMSFLAINLHILSKVIGGLNFIPIIALQINELDEADQVYNTK